MPSGIRPSPHGLSIGGTAPSATITRNPRCLAAMAAAKPAGPPPITKTSVEFNKPQASPLQEYELRTESRPHGSEYAQGSRMGAPPLHHILEHHQHRGGGKIPDLPQAIP